MKGLFFGNNALKTSVLAGLLLLTVLGTAAGFEPFYKLRGYGQTDWYRGTEDAYILLGAGLEAGQRLMLDTGYWSWYGAAQVDHYISGSDETGDKEQFAADLRLNFGSLAWEIGGTVNTAVNSIDYGTLLQPEWSTSLLYSGESGLVYGSLDYSGASFSRERGNEDRLVNGLSGTLGYDPSLRLGLFLSGGVAFEAYRDYYLLNQAGAETGTLRGDRRIEAEVGAEGLAGFFADWKAGLYGQYIDSNTNRWIDSTGLLEENSEDRRLVGLQTELNWSPHRAVQLGFSGFADFSEYLHREVLDIAGDPAGKKLQVLKAGGDIHGSWTSDGSCYVLFGLSLYRSFSEDPEFDTWRAGIEGGLEFLP